MLQPIPNRMSIKKTSRFYGGENCSLVNVYFEGEIQHSVVIEYDLEKQWILRYKRNAEGGLTIGGFGKTLVTERKHGKVEVKWK